MKKIETKICIVGAGPGGATTSLFLSKFKIPHVIVDAKTFPRDKVCGDCLDLKVMRILNTLEPGLVEKEILPNENFTKVNGVLFHLAANKKPIVEYQSRTNQPNFPYFCIAKRNYFDNYLVKKIDDNYASFLQETQVHTITTVANKQVVFAKQGLQQIEITANIIIGADGDHSVVLKHLQERTIDRTNYAAGLRQYWKGMGTSNNATNCLELYLPKSLPAAYLWIFPLPNGEANVGCGLLSEFIATKKVNLKKLFEDIIKNDIVLKKRFEHATPIEKIQGWGLPLASLRRKPMGDGYLLVGDAASLICPTTGEGIGPAMMSGCIAAHFLQRAVEQNDFSAAMFTHYEREIYAKLNSSIIMFKLVTKTFPVLYNVFLNLVANTTVCKMYFQKMVGKWIHTGFSKPFKVKLD